MSESLMQLTGDYLELLDMAQDPDVDEKTLMDTFESINGEISHKAGGCVAVIRHLEGRAERLLYVLYPSLPVCPECHPLAAAARLVYARGLYMHIVFVPFFSIGRWLYRPRLIT